MKISRRTFIKNLSLTGSFLMTGGFASLSVSEIFELRKNVWLRFVVASDGHYGQPETLFDQFHDTLIEKVNLFHKSQPVDFCVRWMLI